MTSFNRKAIKKLSARQAGDGASYKEIFLHTLVGLGVGILLLVLDDVLQKQIGGTGGLSGLGTRSILETVRMVLQYANMLLLPFWEISIFSWAIRRARGQQTRPRDFLEGFRRFGPVLRLKFLQGFVMMLIIFACSMIASLIFSFTPLSWPMMKFLMPYMEDVSSMYAVMENEVILSQLMQYMYPVYIILFVLLIPALIPLYYRFRMAEYVIMDKPRTGAIQALIRSFQLTKKQFVPLLKMDLSYWWFFLLQLLAAACLYLDVLLPFLGIHALDAHTLTILSYATGYGIQILVFTLFRGRIETTYALVYNALNASVPEPKPLIVNPSTWIEE